MEDFITTEYNFELQQIEKEIDERQKLASPVGLGEMKLAQQDPNEPGLDVGLDEMNLVQQEQQESGMDFSEILAERAEKNRNRKAPRRRSTSGY